MHPPAERRPANELRRAFARPGFSLIELVLVLGVVAVVAAMAVPRYAVAQNRYRVDASARRVAAELELARETAEASSAPVVVMFFEGYCQFKVRPARGTPRTPDLSIEPYGGVISTATFGTSDSVTFDAFARPSDAGTVTVRAGRVASTVTVASDGSVRVGTPEVVATRVVVDRTRSVPADIEVGEVTAEEDKR
ncbi:MAG: GspH/FimT family protein [Planctomycetota bacterium]|nr:GspH/FimT family protein [Planctomycetota bacterium]